jgi:type II secretion system protein N
MRRFISKNRKWFGYLLYCIALTLLLLYYRFPSDAIYNYLKITANNLDTPLILSVDRINPWLPLGLRLGNAEISLKNRQALSIFKADNLLVRPEVWSFIKGKKKYCFECIAYGGDIRGSIYFSKQSVITPFNTEISVKGVQIGSYENMKDLVGRRINGILQGTVFYTGQHQNLIDGSGEANIRLLNGSVELLLPILSLDSIKFNEIAINMVLRKQMITIARFELIGPMLKSTLSGTVDLKRQFANSTLNLRGTIEPFTALLKNAEGALGSLTLLRGRLKKGALMFTLRGTIGKPKIKFI